MGDIRRSHEDPTVIARFGWRYHHLGIPHGSPRSGERHLRQLGGAQESGDELVDGRRSISRRLICE